MDWPKVSIIILNYNHANYTEALIKSLERITYTNIEIIIVDNGSKNNNIYPLRDKYFNIKFVLSEKNLGFSGGNNLGINHASGEYYLFLNNDTEVDAGFLEPMITAFLENPDIGIISPKIKFFRTNLIQYGGGERVNPYTGRSLMRGFKQEDLGQYNKKEATEMIHGAAMMIPENIIRNVGLMPEVFFLYYEEIDWCETIKRSGREAWYVPESEVYHKESMSVGKNSVLKTYYMNRNRLLYMRRNTNGLEKISWILFYSFLTFPKQVLIHLSKFELKHLNAFWKGIKWNLVNRNLESLTSKDVDNNIEITY